MTTPAMLLQQFVTWSLDAIEKYIDRGTSKILHWHISYLNSNVHQHNLCSRYHLFTVIRACILGTNKKRYVCILGQSDSVDLSFLAILKRSTFSKAQCRFTFLHHTLSGFTMYEAWSHTFHSCQWQKVTSMISEQTSMLGLDCDVHTKKKVHISVSILKRKIDGVLLTWPLLIGIYRFQVEVSAVSLIL